MIDKTNEITILELNQDSPYVPNIRVNGNKGIIEGNEDQFKSLYDMLVDLFDFQPDYDNDED